MDTAAHRVSERKAPQGYRLRVRFDDVPAQSVFPGGLPSFAGFPGRRNAERRVTVDAAAATLARDDEIRPDPGIPYQDLLSGRPGKRFGSVGFAPSAE